MTSIMTKVETLELLSYSKEKLTIDITRVFDTRILRG